MRRSGGSGRPVSRACGGGSELEKRYDIIDHTADIGIVAYGRDLKETFANAATALFDLIAEQDGVKTRLKRSVAVGAEDREALLVAWLNELIFLFDVERVLFKEFHMKTLTDTALEAECLGDKFNPRRHRLKMGIKAATYHMLKIADTPGGCEATVIFDI